MRTTSAITTSAIIGLASALCFVLFACTIIIIVGVTCVWARKKKRLSSLPKAKFSTNSNDVILDTEPNLSYGVVKNDFVYQDNIVYGIAERDKIIYEVIDPPSNF